MTDHIETITSPQIRRKPWLVPGWVRTTWLFAKRKPLGAAGGTIVLALLVMAAFAEWIAPYHYNDSFLQARLQPYSREFLLGTDNLGRDIFSRVVYGARVSVTVGFGAVSISMFCSRSLMRVSG